MADQRDRLLRWVAVGVLAAVEVGLVAGLLLKVADTGLLVGAITAIAAFLVVIVRASDLRGQPFGRAGGRADLEALRYRVDEAERRTSDLVRLALPREVFACLRKLAGRRYGPYAMGTGLERELRYLRQLGYVDVPSIGAVPKHGAELSDFVKVTPAGERFVELRDQLEREALVPERRIA